MYSYKVYNFLIESDLNLSFQDMLENYDSIIKITEMISTEKKLIKENLHITQKRLKINENKNLIIDFYSGEKFFIDYLNYVSFYFLKINNQIIFKYYFYDNYPQEWKQRLIERYGLSLLLMWLGYVVIHGSAVALNEKESVVFLGDSGCGKSTIAFLLYKNGYEVISDELIVIDRLGQMYRSSNYLNLSNEIIDLFNLINSEMHLKSINFKFNNSYMNINEDKVICYLNKNLMFNSINIKKIFILNRDEKLDKFSIEKSGTYKIDLLKLVRYLYTPVKFDFMIKNLMNLVDSNIEIFSLNYNDFIKNNDLLIKIL